MPVYRSKGIDYRAKVSAIEPEQRIELQALPIFYYKNSYILNLVGNVAILTNLSLVYLIVFPTKLYGKPHHTSMVDTNDIFYVNYVPLCKLIKVYKMSKRFYITYDLGDSEDRSDDYKAIKKALQSMGAVKRLENVWRLSSDLYDDATALKRELLQAIKYNFTHKDRLLIIQAKSIACKGLKKPLPKKRIY